MGSSMVIAVNMLFFSKENESAYLKRIVEALILRNPSHTFIILYEKDCPIEAFSNVQIFHTGLAPHSVEKRNLWWYFKIKKVRKLYNPGILINNGETSATPRDLPQILLYPNLGYLQDPLLYSKRFLRFSRLFTPAFIRKQSVIIVLSSFEKEFIMKHYAIDESKIKVIIARADMHRILPEWEEKDRIKEKYANGFEYFLYSGYISLTRNLLNLLKGFSAFKKRQRSNMQLIITGEEGGKYEEFNKILDTYKYKEDVHVILFTDKDQHHQLLSAAYAALFPYQWDQNISDLFTCLQYEVPAIVPAKSTLSEAGKDGVLEYDAQNIADTAAKLMLLFKDEKHRKKIIESAGNWLLEADYDKGIDKIGKIIESVNRK